VSAEHVGWAFRQQGLPPTRKLVLVALADRCNKDTLRCDPSIRRLMEDTGLGRMTIFRALESLEEAGLIRRVERNRENGSRTSSEYRFPSVTVVRGEYQSDTGEGVTVIPPEPELRTRTEPSMPSTRKRNEIWDALSDIFGEPTTRPAQKSRGQICRDLTEAGATAPEIYARAKRWSAHFDGATLTDRALVKHWDTLPLKPRRLTR